MQSNPLLQKFIETLLGAEAIKYDRKNGRKILNEIRMCTSVNSNKLIADHATRLVLIDICAEVISKRFSNTIPCDAIFGTTNPSIALGALLADHLGKKFLIRDHDTCQIYSAGNFSEQNPNSWAHVDAILAMDRFQVPYSTVLAHRMQKRTGMVVLDTVKNRFLINGNIQNNTSVVLLHRNATDEEIDQVEEILDKKYCKLENVLDMDDHIASVSVGPEKLGGLRAAAVSDVLVTGLDICREVMAMRKFGIISNECIAAFSYEFQYAMNLLRGMIQLSPQEGRLATPVKVAAALTSTVFFNTVKKDSLPEDMLTTMRNELDFLDKKLLQ